MTGNGAVFISHAHDDNDRCAPLLVALRAWGVDYWFDTQHLVPGQDLSERIQRAIAERDFFIRICTPAAASSFWVRLETGAFRGLQAEDHIHGIHHRTLINLILDPTYQHEPFDLATLYIDATSGDGWEEELHRALGDPEPPTVHAMLVPLTSQPTDVVIAAEHNKLYSPIAQSYPFKNLSTSKEGNALDSILKGIGSLILIGVTLGLLVLIGLALWWMHTSQSHLSSSPYSNPVVEVFTVGAATLFAIFWIVVCVRALLGIWDDQGR